MTKQMDSNNKQYMLWKVGEIDSISSTPFNRVDEIRAKDLFFCAGPVHAKEFCCLYFMDKVDFIWHFKVL